jgi:hypothetical protein
MMSAARCLASLRHSTKPILHLIHPNPVSWHSIFSASASILDVPLVTYSTWLTKLISCKSNENVPAIRLLSTFQKSNTNLLDGGHEALGATKLAFTNAEEYMPGLKEERTLDKGDVEAWTRYWQSHGLLGL